MTELHSGDQAPDALLTTLDGQEVSLAGYWQKQPVLLVFLRHFG